MKALRLNQSGKVSIKFWLLPSIIISIVLTILLNIILYLASR